MLPRRFGGPLAHIFLILVCCSCGKSRPSAQAAPDAGASPDAGTVVTVVDEESLPPAVYVTKVKNLLTGLPPTEAEIQAVVADPRALAGLIDGWMTTPEWRQKMLVFFQQAFQQTQTDINDYDDQLGHTTNPWDRNDKPLFVRSAEESFARTVLALIDEGRSFTEVLTTERFMLNPPLMSSYAYMDAVPLDDAAKPIASQLWLLQKFPGLTFVRTTNPDPVTGAPTPIPIEQSIDPASPSFMKWYEPKPYTGTNAGCVEPESAVKVQALRRLGDYMYGGRTGCGSSISHFSAADYQAWRMVTIRPPRDASEERTIFWDLPKLRDPATTELVLGTPRVGFMTTMAFFANWPTNASNSYRVTTDQSLIVGLGTSFDDAGITVQVSETSSDAMHVMPGTVCYGCHQTLDPMRDFFKQTYSLSYFHQLSTISSGAAIPPIATFLVSGSPAVMGNGIHAFANAMAQHPSFGPAWVQKLCAFANSTFCDARDPELQRVTAAFEASRFDFKALTRELFSSRLVTFAARPVALPGGAPPPDVVISVARRDAFCLALEARFQIKDFCSLRGDGPGLGAGSVATQARNLALAIPGAGYARGDAEPLLPHDPNLFFHKATENLCRLAAVQLVNDAAAARYHAAGKDAAIADFVTRLMGIPADDAQAADAKAILDEHYDMAVAQGVNTTDALRSTFMLACQSPQGISLGL